MMCEKEMVMPDKRVHRGSHPADIKLFGIIEVEKLRAAVTDFSMLLTRGYADKSALKLVGDRFNLTSRQRMAVLRGSCSDEQLERRSKTCIGLEQCSEGLIIDGYNLLITIESALSGAVLFKCRDGTVKDLASIHGTYRTVNETLPALELVGKFLENSVGEVVWLLDSPVSNSGRLKKLMLDVAEKNKWKWQVELATNPDKQLSESEMAVVSSDSAVLDNCSKWVNLASEIVAEQIPDVWIIELGKV